MGQAPEHVQILLREHTTSHQCNELHYLKKLPAGSCSGCPMIVFLNGAGERGPADGSELDRACLHGVLKVAMAGPTDSPGLPGHILKGFLILNPQLHVESPVGWADHVHSLKAMIDEVVAEHDVDTNRIYLTGLSMGGMGTWAMAHAYPDLFAAIAPICGIDRLHLPKLDPGLSMQDRRRLSAEHAAANPLTVADMAPLADTPTYIFTGQRDPVVPVSGSVDPYLVLKDAGSKVVRLTVYPQTDLEVDGRGNAQGAHDSWTQTYEWTGLYEWFLSHSLCDRIAAAKL